VNFYASWSRKSNNERREQKGTGGKDRGVVSNKHKRKEPQANQPRNTGRVSNGVGGENGRKGGGSGEDCFINLGETRYPIGKKKRG